MNNKFFQSFNISEIKSLIGTDKLSTIEDAQSNSILHFAAHQGNTEMVELLLTHGVDPKKNNGIKWMPLHYAAEAGHDQVVQLLITHDVTHESINASNAAYNTPLHLAAEKGHANVVQILLANGAKVNQATYDRKYTPLHLAAEKGHADVVQILLTNGAEMNALTNSKTTPLFLASWLNRNLVVDILIKAGADPEITDKCGVTPLKIAMQSKSNEAIRLLTGTIRTSLQDLVIADHNKTVHSSAHGQRYSVQSTPRKTPTCRNQ